ncbi:MAG: hypothetical protein ACLUHA_17270 [Bacteroides stercoris]
MCFLLWEGNGATDLKHDTPQGYASFINLGLGIQGSYHRSLHRRRSQRLSEMNARGRPILSRNRMLNHPYSFDSYAQMGKYFWSVTTGEIPR